MSLAPLKHITAAFTGYRPEKIRLSSSNPLIEKEIRHALTTVITGLYERGFRFFLSGMAEGFDLWAAETVLSLKETGECPEIRLTAVIPFAAQSRSYASASRELYDRIISRSDKTEMLSAAYYPECYLRRNDWLVDHASLVICYFDGQPGGTQYTVRRAGKAGLPVLNLLEPSMLF